MKYVCAPDISVLLRRYIPVGLFDFFSYLDAFGQSDLLFGDQEESTELCGYAFEHGCGITADHRGAAISRL